jgi:hypothetical protein
MCRAPAAVADRGIAPALAMVRPPAAEGSPSTNCSAALQSQSSFQQRDSLVSATKPLHHITLDEEFSTIIYLCKQRDSHLPLSCLCSRALQLPREGFPTASHIPLLHSTLVCSRGIPLYFYRIALRLSQQRDSTSNFCHTALRVERFPSIFLPLQQSRSATSRETRLPLKQLHSCYEMDSYLLATYLCSISPPDCSRGNPLY